MGCSGGEYWAGSQILIQCMSRAYYVEKDLHAPLQSWVHYWCERSLLRYIPGKRVRRVHVPTSCVSKFLVRSISQADKPNSACLINLLIRGDEQRRDREKMDSVDKLPEAVITYSSYVDTQLFSACRVGSVTADAGVSQLRGWLTSSSLTCSFGVFSACVVRVLLGCFEQLTFLMYFSTFFALTSYLSHLHCFLSSSC